MTEVRRYVKLHTRGRHRAIQDDPDIGDASLVPSACVDLNLSLHS